MSEPVVILGMHRSGTSLVAHLLQEAGLFLGESSELMAPNKGNPEGYFEHKRIVELNDRILDNAGAAWDYVPLPRPDQWVEDAWQRFGAEAAGILSDLETRSHQRGGRWGWKDPRTCLTFSFWKRANANIRPVVCLRDPLAVAQSLARRNFISIRLGLSLCAAYFDAIAAATADGDALYLQYEALLTRPSDVIPELLRFCGYPDQAQAEALGQIIRSTLVHHDADIANSAYADSHRQLIDSYKTLQQRASIPPEGTVMVAPHEEPPVLTELPFDLGSAVVSGPVRGAYRDGWIAPALQLFLTAKQTLREVSIEIWAPPALPPSQAVPVTVKLNGDSRTMILEARKRTSARFPLTIAAGEGIYLEMRTDFQVSQSRDKRRLSYIMKSLRFS